MYMSCVPLANKGGSGMNKKQNSTGLQVWKASGMRGRHSEFYPTSHPFLKIQRSVRKMGDTKPDPD